MIFHMEYMGQNQDKLSKVSKEVYSAGWIIRNVLVAVMKVEYHTKKIMWKEDSIAIAVTVLSGVLNAKNSKDTKMKNFAKIAQV